MNSYNSYYTVLHTEYNLPYKKGREKYRLLPWRDIVDTISNTN